MGTGGSTHGSPGDGDGVHFGVVVVCASVVVVLYVVVVFVADVVVLYVVDVVVVEDVVDDT